MTIADSANILWCCHVRGPDDVVPCLTYDEAIRLCDDVDTYRRVFERKHPDEDIMLSAHPAVWPWSAAEHARAYEERYEKTHDYPLKREAAST